MPTHDSVEQIEIWELILSVHDGRAAGDAFKLGAPLCVLVVARLAGNRTEET